MPQGRAATRTKQSRTARSRTKGRATLSTSTKSNRRKKPSRTSKKPSRRPQKLKVAKPTQPTKLHAKSSKVSTKKLTTTLTKQLTKTLQKTLTQKQENTVEFKLRYVLKPHLETLKHRLPTAAQFNKFYKQYLDGFLKVYEYKLAKQYSIRLFDKYMLVTMTLQVPEHHRGDDEQDFLDMLFAGDDDGNYSTDDNYYFHVAHMTDSRGNKRKRSA